MQVKQTKLFSTSVNIIRDKNKDINYIPTPNACRIVEQIAKDFKKGTRSFNIIGSYGTGKSAFLWALEQSLSKKKGIFKIELVKNANVEVLNFVGEYKSLLTYFADYFDVKVKNYQSENIFSEIFNVYHKLGKNAPLLIIAIDEFGKFLEYASQNSPEKELFFIQKLAEFVNDTQFNIALVTTIHQNFDAYSYTLNDSQRLEWTKVKGRFKEIAFNEPVEQLLFLASEYLGEVTYTNDVKKKIKSISDLFLKAKAFSTSTEYVSQIAEKLFPLDLFSANVITLALQRYGQNERSLFSYLESTDANSINAFKNKYPSNFYNLSVVYDYLIYNFYSFLSSRLNPDYGLWNHIKDTLEIVERDFSNNLNDITKIIKTIGLLNIFSSKGAVLDKALMINYCVKSLEISNAEQLIQILEDKNVILFKRYNKCYVLFGGTEVDIHSEIDKKQVDDITDIPTLLKKHFEFPQILAKQYSYINGTPRVFEYAITNEAIQNKIPKEEVDGFINLIFNEKHDDKEIKAIKEISLKEKEATLYGLYKNTKDIKVILTQIEKTKQVIIEQEQSNDKVAVRELSNILLHQQNWLTHKISNSISKDVLWIYEGKEIILNSKRDFNKLLTQICLKVYSSTPTFINEHVNKYKISPTIHTAKKAYYKALVNSWNMPEMGFEKDLFPPEKSIYLSMLVDNNISLVADNEVQNISDSFKPLWKASNLFLQKTKKGKICITEFIDTLRARPFGLKQGLIDFWVPTFLFLKRDEFALFHDDNYLPTISNQTLELLVKDPKEYEIKAFDVEGVNLTVFNKYRTFLNQPTDNKPGNKIFIETIKPFLTFYSQLPEYAKKTSRMKKEASAIREAIAKSKDPEKTFFIDFPIALSFSAEELSKSETALEQFSTKLQKAIKEIQTCYDTLVSRFESFLLDEFIGKKIPFEQYKVELQKRYTKLKIHLLLPNCKNRL